MPVGGGLSTACRIRRDSRRNRWRGEARSSEPGRAGYSHNREGWSTPLEARRPRAADTPTERPESPRRVSPDAKAPPLDRREGRTITNDRITVTKSGSCRRRHPDLMSHNPGSRRRPGGNAGGRRAAASIGARMARPAQPLGWRANCAVSPWWAHLGSNQGLAGYEPVALPAKLWAPRP